MENFNFCAVRALLWLFTLVLNVLKDKEGITITNAFQKFLKESNQKPNKI